VRPVLFSCPLFTIYTYGFLVAVAFVAATTLISRAVRRRGLNDALYYNLCLVLLLCGIFGARAFYVVMNWPFFRNNLRELVMLQHGGLVWYGGLIGATLGGLAYMRWHRMRAAQTLDLVVPYVALAQAIGRIGCFFNGCCHGQESAWGLYFPSQGQKLFPAQLVDAVTLALIYGILCWVQRRNKPGEALSLYFILAALQRFLMEFLRGDPRPFYGVFSIFQWVSLGVALAGVVCAWRWIWKKNPV
jgi:phosphatidylglycerol:prolipoprotein diacylglycerol transferase